MTTNLDSFTDVLADVDEIDNSQPLSLSPGENDGGFTKAPARNPRDGATTETARNTGLANFDCNASSVRHVRPVKHTGQHGDFRSVEEIDPKYRGVFSYPYFNLVQSSVIEDALYTDKSMVVCAPTGSGKTVVFEMAIVQLLMALDDCQYNDDFKIIYMAPVKALCTERLTEWYSKFTKLGILCIEVTGDTDVDFSQLKPYRIIITTPEKWDMLTRRWRDHKSLVSTIKLFLIDEVHILNDESRGPVLEAVVSRMKTIESSFQSAHRIELLQKQYQDSSQACQATNSLIMPGIRFVAVSATVANPQDVAAWLGTKEKPAVYYKFGDECRPVKLKRVVEGYPCGEGCSIFKFDIILNYKLWPVINKYQDGKPTLIFCNTRKSVALTAEALSKEVTVSFSPEQKAKLTALASTIKNKKLQALVLNGVGCHHAGLLYEERLNIEQAFRNRDLPILITTTTLAMGVNLPAHLVIIKNTQQYVNGQYQEYSISTVLQMVGRAGRPQYDTDATAVIMTRMQDKPRYQALVGGDEPLQSYLHKRLAENLNSEAALGTVNDVAQCVQWLRSTFLCVRAAKDPKRYLGLTQASAPAQLITKKLEELCVKAMNSLASSGLIAMDEASCIEATEAGRLMSVYYLDLETMKHIMKINGTETLEALLWLICESHELADMHLRVDERRTLNLLNRNNAAATIRYPMKGKISSRQMKLYCVIQAVLGCLPIPDPSLNQESMKIMRIADRVCKCLVAYVTRAEILQNHPQYFSAVLNSLILTKCIAAHLWENSPYVSKQLKGIGPTFSTLLASAGKTNFVLLEESHPRDLERIMNKGPPAGNVIRKQVGLLPKYQLTAIPVDGTTVTIQLVLLNQAHLSENMDNLTAGDNHKSYIVVGDSENHLLLLTPFKDKDLISVYDGIIKHDIKRIHNFEHKIIVHCISSNFVGIDAQCDYTFKDVAPIYSRGEASSSYTIQGQTPKKINKVQTNITNTYKQRKRKNVDTDISQSKEKIKRESNLVEKFKNLKQQFGTASKNIKANLHKTSEMTDQLIHVNYNPNTANAGNLTADNSLNAFGPSHIDNTPALVEPIYEQKFTENLRGDNNYNEFDVSFNQNTAVPIRPVYETTLRNNQNNTELIPRRNEYFTDDIDYPEMVSDHENVPEYPDMVLEDNDGENVIVDDYIEDILSEIENEMSKSRCDSRKINIISDITLPKGNSNNVINANPSKLNFMIPKKTTADCNNRQLKYTTTNLGKVNLKSKLFTKQEPVESRKRKPANTKSNYSFIDTIEKKFSDDSEDTETVPDSKSGFSNAIKKEIEKFLNNAKTSTTNATISVIEKLVGDDENMNKKSTNMIQNEKLSDVPYEALNLKVIDVSETPEISAKTTQNEKDIMEHSKTTKKDEVEVLDTEKIPNELTNFREIDISELPDVCVDSERKINHPTKDQNRVNNESNIEMGEQKNYCERKINPQSIKDTCEWLQNDLETPSVLDYGEEWSYPKLNAVNGITNDIEMVEHKRCNYESNIDIGENSNTLYYQLKEITNTHQISDQKNSVRETNLQCSEKENINNNGIEKLDKKQGNNILSVKAKFDQSRNKIFQRPNSIESVTGTHDSTLNHNTHHDKPKTDVKSVIALYDLMGNKRSEISNNMVTVKNSKNTIDLTNNNSLRNIETIDRTFPKTNEEVIDLTDISSQNNHMVDLTANNVTKNNHNTKEIACDEWKEPKISHEISENTNKVKSSRDTDFNVSKPLLQIENFDMSDKSKIMPKAVTLKHTRLINTDNTAPENDLYHENNKKTIVVARNGEFETLSGGEQCEHMTQNKDNKSTSVVLPYGGSGTHYGILNETTEKQDISMTAIPLSYPQFNRNIDEENNKKTITANILATQNYSNEKFAQNTDREKLSGDENIALNCYPNIPLNLNNVDQRDITDNNRTQNVSIEAHKAYLKSLSTHTKDRNQNSDSNINIKDQYVNKYSFTGTKIDVSTKNAREHQVQIIKRLKIDFDVTEIISKTNTVVHNNEKRQQESRAWYSESVTRTKPENLDSDRSTNYCSNQLTLPEKNKVGDGVDANNRANNIVLKINKDTMKYPELETPYGITIPQTTERSNGEMTGNYNYKFDESKLVRDVQDLRSKRPFPTLKEITTIDNAVQDVTTKHYETPNNEQVRKGTKELFHKTNTNMKNIEQNNSDNKEIPNYTINNNLKKKKDKEEISTDVKIKNNERKIEETAVVEQKLESGVGNKKVESILEKYGRLLRKTTIDLNNTTTKNLKNTSFFKEPEKPKRPFKISEIHKAEVALPKTLEVEVVRSQRPTDDEVLTRVKGIEYNNSSSQNPYPQNNFEGTKTDEARYLPYNNREKYFEYEKTNQNQDICVAKFNRAMSFEEDNFIETNTDFKTQSNNYEVQNMILQNNPHIIPISDDIPELDVSSTQLEEMCADYDYDLDLDTNILDPKVLLQRFNQETTEPETLLKRFTEETVEDTNIIPPPMEFRENYIYNRSAYSPTICNDYDSALQSYDDENDYEGLDQSKYGQSYADYLNNLTENAEGNHDVSIFNDTRSILTPSNEIETWTFSTEFEGNNDMYDPRKSCTVMRNNSGGTQIKAPIKAKLSQFRVPYKDKFRL